MGGPFLDRIDLHIEVPAVPYQKLRGNEEPVYKPFLGSEPRWQPPN